MDSGALSRAVAEVVRRELAGRQTDWADFAAQVGLPKTTVWRKLNGSTKLTIDDVASFASGLGWTLPDLIARAEAAASTPAASSMSEHLINQVSTSEGREALRQTKEALSKRPGEAQPNG